MPTINSRCHCGNLQARLVTAKQSEDMWLRACQCDFCRSHNMRSLSDPEGSMEIRARHGEQVNRYHFGLGTVDFLICKTCGNYIGAVQQVDGQRYGIMNANLTENRGVRFGEAEHRFYEEETGEERAQRRKRVWTPAVLVIEG